MDKPVVFSRCGLMWWANIMVSVDMVIWCSGALQMKLSAFKPTSHGSLEGRGSLVLTINMTYDVAWNKQ